MPDDPTFSTDGQYFRLAAGAILRAPSKNFSNFKVGDTVQVAAPGTPYSLANSPGGSPASLNQAPATYRLQSQSGSFSWGSAPGTATLVYVGDNPIVVGASISFQLGVNLFCGICLSCTETTSISGGRTWQVEFVDLREYLTWDFVYGAFNKPDVRLLGGTRIKRYKHLLPANFNAWRWTYTNDPLTAAQILNYIMTATTVGSPWEWDLTENGLFPFGVLSGPVFDIDFTNGMRLDAALNELCAKAGGVVFTLQPTAGHSHRLVFTRKGYRGLDSLPAWLRDDQKDGLALAGNPTNIRILGDRNLYQIMDVPLVPDWARAWEVFMDFSRFVDYLFANAKDPQTGTRFNAFDKDVEQYQGRQLAAAYAHEITVRDFVALVNELDPNHVKGNDFIDNRKFNYRSRMLMPCKMYLETLVFRAFKPDMTSFVNFAGNQVPLDALNLADNLLCRVAHNAQTGEMTFDASQPTDDNGYAIVKGFMVMPEMLRMIKSDQFNADFYNSANRAWGRQSFQIDDSGEGNRFLIMDEVVVAQDEANPFVVKVDNHVVFNAAAKVAIPQIKAALCFQAEPYSYWKGSYPNVSRDHCENVNGLNAEYVVQDNDYVEVTYADGKTADQKAAGLADYLLLRQYVYYEGGRSHVWDGETPINEWGTPLSSLVDRVQTQLDPAGGLREQADLTKERRRDHFEPERELDRRTAQNALFPGQMDLRRQAELLRQNAQALRQMPQTVLDLFGKFIRGELMPNGPVTVTTLKPGAAGTLPAGSVIRSQPLTQSGGKNINTAPEANPIGSPDQRTVFVGVTTAHNLDATGTFSVQTGGHALALVQGPVAVNDPVGLSRSGGNFLEKGGATTEGKTREAIPDSSVKLIKVNLGGGASSPPAPDIFRGDWTPNPGAPYLRGQEVKFGGLNTYGIYLNEIDGNTNAPDSGIGWVQTSSITLPWS